MKKITSAILSLGMFLMVVSMAGAQTSVTVADNGKDSENKVEVHEGSSSYVSQTNAAKVDNKVIVESETGGNDANGNTGGDVKVKTGESEVSATVITVANLNVAKDDDCGCPSEPLDLKIKGNGKDSSNKIKVSSWNSTKQYQHNYSDVDNFVKVESETGDNEAKYNTGGNVKVKTGKSKSTVSIFNLLNGNFNF